MKKLAIVLAAVLALSGCAEEKKLEVNGKSQVYQTYGLLNAETHKSPDVCYSANVVSVILGAVFFQTIVAPVYVFGFSMYEPMYVKGAGGSCQP